MIGLNLYFNIKDACLLPKLLHLTSAKYLQRTRTHLKNGNMKCPTMSGRCFRKTAITLAKRPSPNFQGPWKNRNQSKRIEAKLSYDKTNDLGKYRPMISGSHGPTVSVYETET